MCKVMKGESKTGYVMVDKDEIIPIDTWTKDKPNEVLILPPNSCGRQWFNINRLSKVTEVELSERIPRQIGTVTRTESKPLESYLNEEEAALYLELVAKAKAARAEANKPVALTALQKAEREFERAKERVALLQAAEKESK